MRDAITVVKSLCGTECPATAARRLVTDVSSDGGTLRPSGADIERGRDGVV